MKGFDGEYVGVRYGPVRERRLPRGAGRCHVGRSRQALFSTGETRVQVYVDDPCTVWRGTPEVRSWNKVILLLWWFVVGPAISWKKLQIGRQVKWIGVQVQLEEKAVAITLPDKFIAELLVEVEQLPLAAAVPTGRLRKLAGRAEWTASVVPYLKAMISPIWKALGDAQRGTIGRRRIAHSLRWLRAFLLRRRGTLQRSYHPDDGYAAADLVMEFDASPWVGKVLLHHEVGGVPAKRLTGRTWGSVQVAIPGPTHQRGSQGNFARRGGGQVRDRFPRAHSRCEQRVRGQPSEVLPARRVEEDTGGAGRRGARFAAEENPRVVGDGRGGRRPGRQRGYSRAERR